MLLVEDVKKSAAFYVKLLEAENDHGRPDFDRIVAGGRVLFMLHEWGAEEHGGPRARGSARVGHGCLFWVYVADLDAVYARARRLKVEIVLEPHANPQAGWREFTLIDPDGYRVAIVEQ